MPQTATIKSLPDAFRMLKAMQAEGIEVFAEFERAIVCERVLAGLKRAKAKGKKTRAA